MIIKSQSLIERYADCYVIRFNIFNIVCAQFDNWWVTFCNRRFTAYDHSLGLLDVYC